MFNACASVCVYSIVWRVGLVNDVSQFDAFSLRFQSTSRTNEAYP